MEYKSHIDNETGHIILYSHDYPSWASVEWIITEDSLTVNRVTRGEHVERQVLMLSQIVSLKLREMHLGVSGGTVATRFTIYFDNNELELVREAYAFIKERANVDEGKRHTITKFDLYSRYLKSIFLTMTLPIATVFTVALSIGFRNRFDIPLPLLVILLFVGFNLLWISLLALAPLKSFLWIGVQEKFLAFKFNEEMKEHDVTCIPFDSNHWFIMISHTSIIAFRRDYIVNLENYRTYNTYSKFGGTMKADEVTVVCKDGNRRKVSCRPSTHIVSRLRNWVEGRETNESDYLQ